MGKAGFRREHRQTPSLECHTKTPSRDELSWPIRYRQSSPERLSCTSAIHSKEIKVGGERFLRSCEFPSAGLVRRIHPTSSLKNDGKIAATSSMSA